MYCCRPSATKAYWRSTKVWLHRCLVSQHRMRCCLRRFSLQAVDLPPYAKPVDCSIAEQVRLREGSTPSFRPGGAVQDSNAGPNQLIKECAAEAVAGGTGGLYEVRHAVGCHAWILGHGDARNARLRRVLHRLRTGKSLPPQEPPLVNNGKWNNSASLGFDGLGFVRRHLQLARLLSPRRPQVAHPAIQCPLQKGLGGPLVFRLHLPKRQGHLRCRRRARIHGRSLPPRSSEQSPQPQPRSPHSNSSKTLSRSHDPVSASTSRCNTVTLFRGHSCFVCDALVCGQ